MFGTYLLRELVNRRRQTIIVAIGLALAIALVIIVNSVSAGVRDAQASVLSSVYGVGTDITVSQPPEPPGEGEGPQAGGPLFQFDAGDGAAADGSTDLSQSVLAPARGATTFDQSALDTALDVDGVEAATATLSLSNIEFSGELPAPPAEGEGPLIIEGEAGGTTSFGGGDFDVNSFDVEGIPVDGAAVGPLTSAELVDGRGLESGDAGENVVVLDESWATAEGHAVGDTIDIGGEDFEVIGIVASTSADATTASDTYIPLDTAQRLADMEDQVTTIYVQATSADSIDAIAADLEAALPDATVSTQADLASSVSGSLSSAAGLIANLGTWLSLIVLAAAFLIAILFTISGVTRRTREFGTLKAIGWSNGRVVRQVAGESLVQGLLGGAVGVALGLLGVLVVNLIAPTFTASASATPEGAFVVNGGGPAGGPGGPAGADPFAAATTEVALHAPVTIGVILIAVGLAVLGGILAGVIGGWRASRLRPAEALRSVA